MLARNAKMVLELIEKGADVNTKNNDQRRGYKDGQH